jgi:hypothetical protein
MYLSLTIAAIVVGTSAPSALAATHISNGNGLGPTDVGIWYEPIYDATMWRQGGDSGHRGVKHRPLSPGSLAYKDLWIYVTNDVNYLYNDYHFSDSIGASVSFTFYGTGIKILGPRGPQNGLIDVYIDDVFRHTEDTSLPHVGWDSASLFEWTGLDPKAHTVKAVLRYSPNSGGTAQRIDAFKDQNTYYYGQGANDYTTEWTIVNDNDRGYRHYDSSEIAIMDFHIQQLAAGRIDFVLFDTTNGGMGGYANMMGGWDCQIPAFFVANVEAFCQRLAVWNNDPNHSWKIKYAFAVGTWYLGGCHGNAPTDPVVILNTIAADIKQKFVDNQVVGDSYYKLDTKPLLVVHSWDHAAYQDIIAASGTDAANNFLLRPSGSDTYPFDSNDSLVWYGWWPIPVANLLPYNNDEVIFISPSHNTHTGNYGFVRRDKGSYYRDRWNEIFKWPSQQKPIPKIVLLGSFNEYLEENGVWTTDTSHVDTQHPNPGQADEQWLDQNNQLNPALYWNMTITNIAKLRKYVAFWPGENTANDVFGSLNGTLEGGASFDASGKVGSAFSFNGVNQDVKVVDNDALDLSSGMTLEAWIRPSRSGYWQNIISKWDAIYMAPAQKSYVLGLYPDNRVYVGISRNGDDYGTQGSKSSLSTASIPLNEWTHVAGSYDGLTLRIYINGKLAGPTVSYSGIGNIFKGTDDLSIGAVVGGGGFISPFQGRIDQPAIYKRALDQGEILVSYKAGLGAVASWPGEEGACDVIASQSGMLEGAVSFTAGKVGKAFSFNGIDQDVRVWDRAGLHLTSGMTLEAWIKPSRAGVYQNIISKWDGCYESPEQKCYLIGLEPGNHVYIGFSEQGNDWNSTSVQSTSTISTTDWTHVAGTYDGTTLTIYVNGSAQATRSHVGTIWPGTDDLSIGAVVGGCMGQMLSPFQGLIDEPTVYNRALSAAEIATIRNASMP